MMKLSQRDSLLAGAGLVGLVWYLFRRQHAAAFYQGKVVVITGGSRGLGLALARACARRGAHVALLARDADELRRAKASLEHYGTTVSTWTCDLNSDDEIARRIDEIGEFHKRIDVLINCAGEIIVGPSLPLDRSEFERLMNLHFWAPFHAINHTLPFFKRQGGGNIINIASFGGKVPVPHMLSYTASKFAVVGFSEGLQAELVGEGVRVTTVCPFVIRTGSHLHAEFKGNARQEFNWFSAGMQTSLTSISAKRVARRIIDAASLGIPVLLVPWQSRLLTMFHAVFPNTFAMANALFKQLLPRSNDPAAIRHLVRGKALMQHPGLPANRVAKEFNE
ncbi:MAG: SDR family NAD(P)-dependent oxidoreductase [Verrucomicrobia bacterium]|nr:SDR family NAD(P)-dependent oxidoreductase [Verrucomicrobiota bacterium]